MSDVDGSTGRIADACTLPAVERSGRLDEFTALLAAGRGTIALTGPTRATVTLPLQSLEAAASLAARERMCCSFLTITIVGIEDRAVISIEVPPEFSEELAGLAGRGIEATR